MEGLLRDSPEADAGVQHPPGCFPWQNLSDFALPCGSSEADALCAPTPRRLSLMTKDGEELNFQRRIAVKVHSDEPFGRRAKSPHGNNAAFSGREAHRVQAA